MKIYIPQLVAVVLLMAGSHNTLAANEDQMQAIKALGELNGIALSCRQLEQTQRMKQAMVENLPKLRYLGDYFDQASNDAFLAFSNEHRLCPVKSEFAAQVTAAIDKLAQQFSKSEK